MAAAIGPTRETVKTPLVGPAFEALGCAATMLTEGGQSPLSRMVAVAVLGAATKYAGEGAMVRMAVSVGSQMLSSIGVMTTSTLFDLAGITIESGTAG